MLLLVSAASSGQRIQLDPVSLQLSSANEASYRCMLQMKCIRAMHFEAELRNENDEVLCSSGAVSLRDDDWVCLSTMETAAGDLHKLLSCMRDCPGGWTFCFDVKERPDGTAVLTHVRVVRSGAGPEIVETAEAETVSAVSHSPAADVVDCTEPEERHPVHRNLLRLFHQPRQQMLDPNFWKQLVGDATQFLSIGNFWSGNEEHREMDLAASLRDINFTGFCRVQMPFNALQELAVAMERLQQNGFPPVFVFVFDQPWQMLHELFQPVATLLGKSPDEMHMSLSVFAWALQCGVSEQAGSNFGRAHRDKSYDDSHTDGRVGMLTTWIPLTPVGPEDGCMHVVPSAFDELFNSSDPKHLRPETPETPETHGEALSCKAGEVLIWKANLIHWGASCTSTRPRRSMATAFVTEDVKAFKALASVMRHELPEDLETRLRIIVKSLLQYKSWYPNFQGLDFLGTLEIS